MIALTSHHVGAFVWHRRLEKKMVPHQLLLFHALHQDDEQMLGLRAAVGERLLDGDQQLVSQGLVNYAAQQRKGETRGRIRSTLVERGDGKKKAAALSASFPKSMESVSYAHSS